jgi:hypothetical protein
MGPPVSARARRGLELRQQILVRSKSNAQNVILAGRPSPPTQIFISSIDNLSIFSSGSESRHVKSVVVVPKESSPSIGELWPNIDEVDKKNHDDTSVVCAHEAMLCDRKSSALARMAAGRSGCQSKSALPSDAPGPSNSMPMVHGKGSVKKGWGKASVEMRTSQIMSAALRAISPRMRMSFASRPYSPSTGMEWSEWEIILEQLIHMGYIVKEEPDSDGNE